MILSWIANNSNRFACILCMQHQPQVQMCIHICICLKKKHVCISSDDTMSWMHFSTLWTAKWLPTAIHEAASYAEVGQVIEGMKLKYINTYYFLVTPEKASKNNATIVIGVINARINRYHDWHHFFTPCLELKKINANNCPTALNGPSHIFCLFNSNEIHSGTTSNTETTHKNV